MMFWRSRRGNMGLLLVLLLCAGSLDQACAASQWRTAETDEFIVIGDARPREITRVLEGIQVYRSVAGLAYPALVTPAPYKPHIFVLSRKSFDTFMLRRSGIAGFVVPHDFNMDIVVRADSESDWMGSRVVVQHELTHFYLRLNYRRVLPVWFDEGLADFLSTIDFVGKRARIGIPPPARLYSLFAAGRRMAAVAAAFCGRQAIQRVSRSQARIGFLCAILAARPSRAAGGSQCQHAVREDLRWSGGKPGSR